METLLALCHPITGPLGPLVIVVLGMVVCAALQGRVERAGQRDR